MGLTLRQIQRYGLIDIHQSLIRWRSGADCAFCATAMSFRCNNVRSNSV
jgi:hypothetical protein